MKTHTVLIDSRDREHAEDTTSSHYRISLPVRLRNVVSARLVSAEVPSSFYVFTKEFENTSMALEVDGIQKTITIPDGNYTAASLASAIKASLQSTYDPYTFRVTVSASTLRLTIESLGGYDVVLDTSTSVTKATEWGLAYYLGFEKNTVYAGSTIISPRVVSPNPYSYIVLDIEELNGAYEGSPEGGGMAPHGCLAKLPLNTNSFDYMFVDSQNVSKSPIEFSPPLPTVERLRVAFRFHDGRLVNFQSLENSFILELVTKDPGVEVNVPKSLPSLTLSEETQSQQKHQFVVLENMSKGMKTLEQLTQKQYEDDQSFRKKLWVVFFFIGACAVYLMANVTR